MSHLVVDIKQMTAFVEALFRYADDPDTGELQPKQPRSADSRFRRTCCPEGGAARRDHLQGIQQIRSLDRYGGSGDASRPTQFPRAFASPLHASRRFRCTM
jgi:hypothetical protein